MTITFVLIGIAILLGIAACLTIGLCQRFRQEQDRPLIINRIISVRPLRRTTKIDKSKNDVPPAYDDVIVSGNGEAETEVDGAERHEEETECHIGLDVEAYLPAGGEHVPGDESEVDRSTSGEHRDANTVTPEQLESPFTANTIEAPPPGYKDVEDNRASHRVFLHQPRRDTRESTETCAKDDS
ncbi:uncharacterized protein LOC117108591 isoform X2 [Anneissia japonica]|nr:uncharacterized protein LOC117108591 isoform X2 [Anneissia japonica]